MWTKREIITEALAELAIGSTTFDIEPEEYQTALRRLDTMMAELDRKGIQVGYALPASPAESDLDQASGLPDWANEPVLLNLAVKLAPGYGKTVRIETTLAARSGLATLSIGAAQPPQQQIADRLPRGAGNKPWRHGRPYHPEPDTGPLGVTPGGNLDIRG